MRQIMLDTETTGLSAREGDRIIEIGCVEVVNRELTGNNYHQYINPERDSHEEALAIHGLTTQFLSDKPKFSQIAKDFCEYIRGAELVIHNASFDIGFLDMELARLNLPAISEVASSVTDSLAIASATFPGHSVSLDSLCKRYGIDNSHRTLHGALLDAELLAEVYIALTRVQETLGIESFMSNSGDVENFKPLSDFKIKVIAPDETEAIAHQQILNDIEKSNKGQQCIWQKIIAPLNK